MSAICSSLRFAPGYAGSSFKLFEVDEPTLQELLKDDGSVHIKGGDDDEALLCTRDRTFVMRSAESSNSMLLAPSRPPATGAGELSIQASTSAHFELLPSAPRVGQLRGVLGAWPYAGPKAEAADGGEAGRERPSLAQLGETVQCSDAELRVALKQVRGLCVNGGWCVLEPQLETDIMDVVLSLAVEHEWPIDAIPAADCVRLSLAQMEDFDALAITHCLRCHSALAEAPWDEWVAGTERASFALDPRAISTFRARCLLTQCDEWPRDSFFEAWGGSLSFGITPEPSDLEGLAISSADGASLQALPFESLPVAAVPRFEALFKVKREWSMAELLPYVRDLIDPTSSAERLVLTHGRGVKANDGSMTYVPRFG
jgi:sister chromatid cohesion protein DCC1